MKKLNFLILAALLSSSFAFADDSYAPSFEDTQEFLAPVADKSLAPKEIWTYKFELIGQDDTKVLSVNNANSMVKPASTMKLFTGWWAYKNQYRDDAYLALMLKLSVNKMADATQKEMGGAYAMEDFYQDLGLELDETNFYSADGSGLSYDNKTTCQTEVDLLKLIKMDEKYESFKVLLAQPGKNQEGTLKTRLTTLAGKVFAKTGTLNRTASLSGFLETSKGTVVFCVMADYLKLVRDSKRRDITLTSARKKIDDMVRSNYDSVN